LTFLCRETAAKSIYIEFPFWGGVILMGTRFRLRTTLTLATLGLAAILGGCVVYPAYPTYPAYGYGGYAAPYYGGGYYGGGWRR
jgi:hypothetical protein